MRIKASYTVENAVIVPMFMIIIMIMLRLCCDMHDELIKASVNSQVVVQTELNDFGKDEKSNVAFKYYCDIDYIFYMVYTNHSY